MACMLKKAKIKIWEVNMENHWEEAIVALDTCIKDLYVCRLRLDAARRNIRELKEWFEPVRPAKQPVRSKRRHTVKSAAV
jgi:hypothetical protein